jgi:hypothetical protein
MTSSLVSRNTQSGNQGSQEKKLKFTPGFVVSRFHLNRDQAFVYNAQSSSRPAWPQRFMMCSARFSTLSAASLTASLKVGCE